MVGEAQRGDEDQLIAGLAEFGLGRNEARLYLAAFGRPAMRAAELAQLANIGRTKVYDALRLLIDKGLFTEEPGRVARFCAADPRTAVQRLRQQSFLERARLVEDTSRLVADLFQRYYAAPRAEDPFDFVELLQQGETAWARQEAMLAGARKEAVRVRGLPPPGAAPPPDLLSLRPDVRYRSICERGALPDRRFRAWLLEREAQGEQIRFAEQVHGELCVVDGRSVMLSLNRTGAFTGQGNWLALEHAGLGGLITEVFERQWSAALPATALDEAR